MGKRNSRLLVVSLLTAVLCGAPALADVQVTTDPAASWLGYMNWFELPANGGAWAGGSAWGTADLPAVFTGDELKLSPNTNTYNAVDPYWVNPDGSGNKWMEANMYLEDASFLGQTVEFTGLTLEQTFVTDYEARAFIKVLDPGAGWSVVAEAYTTLVDDQPFSVSLAVPGTAGLVPQYGFVTTGPNADPATVDQLGHAIVAPIPEPASILLILAATVLVRRR